MEQKGIPKWTPTNNDTMNSNNDLIFMVNISQIKDRDDQIISDEAMLYLNTYINIWVCGSMAICGTVDNIINMIVFYKLGLKDSMAVALMALAFTDFLTSFLVMVSRAFPIWDTFFETDALNPNAIEYVGFEWIASMLFLCSGWITTFLSMERCVCVIFPFKVRQIFTKARSFATIVIIYVVHVTFYMPVLVTHWVGWSQEPVKTVNGTTIFKDRMVVKVSKNRRTIRFYSDIAVGAILPIPSQVLVLISVIWMIYGLKTSSKFRESMTSGEDEKQSKFSTKTRRLMMMVLLLAIILTVCNIPRFVAVYIRHFNPEVGVGKKESNLFEFLWHVVRLASAINASVNIFVYLTINSSYKATFKAIFRLK